MDSYSDLYTKSKKIVSEIMKPFTAKDLTDLLGVIEKPRIVGRIFLDLANEGLIKENGSIRAKYTTAKGIKSGGLVKVWISREYSIKQSQNRKQDKTLNLFES